MRVKYLSHYFAYFAENANILSYDEGLEKNVKSRKKLRKK